MGNAFGSISIFNSLFSITAIGAYDWAFGMVDKKTKELAATMQEFLISPVLYVAMGILNKRLNKDQQAA